MLDLDLSDPLVLLVSQIGKVPLHEITLLFGAFHDDV